MNHCHQQLTKMKQAKLSTRKEKLRTQGKQQGQKKNYLTENQPLIKVIRDYLERPDHLPACFNKKPPPNIDKKTGDQAAKKGFIIPLTPRELKLKLKM